jgi:hypothetical protein
MVQWNLEPASDSNSTYNEPQWDAKGGATG